MAKIYTISPLIFSLAFLTAINAWTFSTTNVNLVYPPPLNSGYQVENGTKVAGNSDSSWPCIDVPVAENVSIARVPFPISGGRIAYAFTNTSVGSLKDYQYEAWGYLGEVSLGNGTYTTIGLPGSGMNWGYQSADIEVFDDFSTGPGCSDPWDMLGLVTYVLGEGDGELTAADLVGMNATIGVRIVLFGPNTRVTDMILDDFNQEEIYQCGYVTLTDADLSKDPNAGYCNGGGYLDPSSPPPVTSTSLPHTSPTPTTLHTYSLTRSEAGGPSATSVVYVPTDSPIPTGSATDLVVSSSHTVAIGAGVGVSMGASLLIVIIAFIFVRRRKARKLSGTIGADVIVTGPMGTKSANKEKSGKDKPKYTDVESSSSSIHSEPLPLYEMNEPQRET